MAWKGTGVRDRVVREQSPSAEVTGEETEMTLRWGDYSKEGMGRRVSQPACAGHLAPPYPLQEAQPLLPLAGLMGTPRP